MYFIKVFYFETIKEKVLFLLIGLFGDDCYYLDAVLQNTSDIKIVILPYR